MRTPVLEVLRELAPVLVRAACSNEDREAMECRLQDRLNAEFGDTAQTVEVLENLLKALRKVPT